MNDKLAKYVTWTVCIGILLSIWLVPAVGFAADAATTSAAGDVLVMILKVVFSVLGVLATWLMTKAIGYFEKKTKIDIPASMEATLAGWSEKAVNFAWEKSHQKAQEFGEKLKGSEKLELALGFVTKLVREHKLPAVAEEKLKAYIESALGMARKDETNSVVDAEDSVTAKELVRKKK